VAEAGLIEKRIVPERHLAWLTLNRPEKKNALSNALMAELIDGLKEISARTDIKAIVLDAKGDSFCSGLDLFDLKERSSTEQRWGAGGSTPEIVTLLRAAPQITIAAVQGYCLGGGLVLVNGCDLAVAADTAKLGMPEILRGSYGAVATPTLFKAGIPNKTAFRIQLTGENLNGAEALACGLVSHVVPEAELKSAVDALAGAVAQRHRGPLAHAKIAAYSARDLPFDLALRVDELVSHRMRFYMNPLSDVESYLKSQRGGGSTEYKRPDAE
jgi:enoyl-CoA hydratase/carnithine racemase